MFEKKKILILEDSKQSVFGGGQVITARLITALQNNVDLFDTASGASFPVMPVKILSRPASVLGEKQAMNVDFLLLLKLIFALINSNLVILRHLVLNRSEYSHIYTPTKFGLLSAFLSRIILRIPVVFHAHNVFDNDRKTRLFFFLLKIIATMTISVSKTVSLSMPKTLKKVVVYNPIKKSGGQLRTPDENNVYAVVGNFMPYKGHEFLLNELNRCKHFSADDLELRFYGDGPLSDGLKMVADQCDFNVKFMGFCKDMDDQYSEIDCLLIPSLQPEAFSLVIGEAWCNNTFVIASDLGAHSELIEHGKNGLLFAPSIPGDLCKTLMSLKKIPQKNKLRMLKNAREKVDSLSISSFENEIRKIFWSENL